MATLKQAIASGRTTTTNGMAAHKGTANACVDLFFKIGALRGRNDEILALFNAAYAEDPDRAVRIALWARDIRGGAGERDAFKTILKDCSAKGRTNVVKAFIDKAPELGRWDDILVKYSSVEEESYAFDKFLDAIMNGSEAELILNEIDSYTEEECASMLANMKR